MDIQTTVSPGVPTSDEGKLAKRNRQLYTSVIGGRWSKYRRDQQKWQEFSLGEQLTATELSDLQRAGMPTFIVNRITPAIETLRYFVTANNPKPVAIGREGSDTDKALIVNGMFEYCWDVSSGRSVFAQVVRDSLTVGAGFWNLYFDPSSDEGLGDVKFGYIPWTDVYVDPSSTDVYFRDAGYVIVKKDIKRGILANELPDYRSIIMRTNCNDERSFSYSSRDQDASSVSFPSDISTMMAVDGQDLREEDIVDYYEGYYRTRNKFWNVSIRVLPTKSEMDAIVQRVDADTQVYAEQLKTSVADAAITLNDSLAQGEISQQRFEFELQKLQKQAMDMVNQYRQGMLSKEVEAISAVTSQVVSDADFKLLTGTEATRSSIVDAIPFWKRQVEVVCSIGDQTMLYKYTLDIDDIPIVPLPYIHTGTPYCMSAVSLVIGQQEEINKAHQLMIYNTSLGASLRFWYYVGSADVDYWRKNLFIPGAMLPVNPGSEPPGVIQPIALPSAFLEVVQLGGNYIDETLGASPLAQGKMQPTDTTYRGLVAMDEFGTRRIRAWVTDVVDPSLEFLAKIWLQYARLKYKSKKVFRIVNPDNKKVQEYQINVPVYNDLGELVDRWNDMSTLKYDIKFVSGGTLPSNRWAKAQEYMELYKLGLIDDIAAIAELDVSDKEGVIKRKSLYAQLTAQVAQMEEELKKYKGTNETLERQIIQAGITDKIKEADVEIRSRVAQHKAGLDSDRSQFKAELQATLAGIRADADLAKKRMGDEVKGRKEEARAKEAAKKA